MATYLLIGTRDPFESKGVDGFFDLAAGLAREGHRVTVFLVQDGVFAARPSRASERLGMLQAASVEVLADDFSLRERGIERLTPGVRPAPLDTVIERMEAGCKSLWH
jgi:sulfur relay (sulfurtransferase) complex TusBCD TusD component (DsrE family)